MKIEKPHTLSFCYRNRIKLGEVLRSIEERNHRRSIKVPVPWRVAYLMLLVKEALDRSIEGSRRRAGLRLSKSAA